MTNQIPVLHTVKEQNNIGLQLSPIVPDAAYLKEWNERGTDFVCLTKNGELISNSLYRIGGLNKPKPGTDRYFMLLKYVEAHYSAEILKMSGSKDSKHLKGLWCIIDSNGIEKKEFPNSLSYPSLIKNSCIYTIDRKYYNIETGELYCYALKSVECSEFLFLQNEYDKDKSKHGVMKIDKLTGKFEFFKEK